MPSKTDKYVGLKFANNWEILERYSCSEYKAIYEEMTGDTTKIIKNAHYFVRNNECGIETYMERSTIQRNLNKECLSKCKGCNGIVTDKCYYKTSCRVKPLYKIPDRQQKVFEGHPYGLFTVLSVKPSKDYADHQQRVDVKCNLCGTIQEDVRLNSILEETHVCECFKSHSVGEAKIKKYLDDNGYNYRTEYTFEDLFGEGRRPLRYDFAIFDDNNELAGLIEFDGEQHYSESGSYYNEDGLVQIHDKRKNEYAESHNIPLLRIPYTKITKINEIIFPFLLSLFEEEYVYLDENDEQILHTIDGSEIKIGKAVYATFGDTSLDINDPSWDVDYKDKNPENCAIENLIFVKNF